MKDKTSGSGNRLSQVAEELHKLADGIGAGHVKISGIDLSIMDSITLKVKQKMTVKKVIFDLKIQALLVEDETIPVGKSPKKPRAVSSAKRPYDVKALKKRYTALWRQFTTAIKKGEYPDFTVVADLHKVSNEYGISASPEWSVLWLECEALIIRCVDLAEAGDFSAAQQVMREIDVVKTSCHKQYK
jgi:hypothetical protein